MKQKLKKNDSYNPKSIIWLDLKGKQPLAASDWKTSFKHSQ